MSATCGDPASEKQRQARGVARGPASLMFYLFACRQAGYLIEVDVVLVLPRIGVVTTAGLSLYGSITSRETICLSVLAPTSFPNTGAMTVTATLVLSCDAPFGTLPVYEHTPPQPYSMLVEEVTRVPFNMVTLGGLIFPPLLKFRGP